MITRDDLLAAIRVNPLHMRNCSMCGYPCHFEFRNGVFGYDGGCDCVTYDGWSPRPVEELDFYLDPQHGHIEKLTKFVEENKHVTT